MDEMSRLIDKAEAHAPRVPHDVIKAVLTTFDKWGGGQSVGLSAEEALELAGQLTALAQPVPAHSGHYGAPPTQSRDSKCRRCGTDLKWVEGGWWHAYPEGDSKECGRHRDPDYGVCPVHGLNLLADGSCLECDAAAKPRNPAYGAGGEL